MRLFSKVFFSIMTILCLALAVSGYLLMSSSFTENFARETERAIDAWRMTGYVLQSTLSRSVVTRKPDRDMFAAALPEIAHSGIVSVFDETGAFLYSEYQGEEEPKLPAYRESEDGGMRILTGSQELDGVRMLTVAGPFYLMDHRLYLMLTTDISDVTGMTDRQLSNYRMIYIGVCFLALFAVGFVTIKLVQPIERTARSAARIAKGNYRTRVKAAGDDELGDLVKSFNAMARAVDKSVEALNESVAEKEDFVGNFAHELKTPLTSVIGYADMLTQKNLTEAQVKSYAGYILDEGLRLEALSYKLMELIVLNKQDFVFEALSVRDIFANVEEGILPMMKEHAIDARAEAEDAYIRVEFDLFKTMLLNLIDNAVKADAHSIKIAGHITDDTTLLRLEEEARRRATLWQEEADWDEEEEELPFLYEAVKRMGQREKSENPPDLPGAMYYVIEIADDGRGMPPEALSRITEAFYMVDKSRSRAQHGAGLGLALVKRITELHRARLLFESREGAGTTVRIVMPLLAEDMVSREA